MPAHSPYDVTLVERQADRVVAWVAGEIDYASAGAFRDEVLTLLSEGDRHLVLDCSGIGFCDSAGIKALVSLTRHLHDNDGQLMIARPPGNLGRTLDMTGLTTLIPVHPTVPNALAALPDPLGVAAAAVSGFDPAVVARTYSAVAEDYALTYASQLDRLDLDRELLDGVAHRVVRDGRVLDLGCGPAHVGRYLADRGVNVVGVDAAAGMLAVARDRNPAFPGLPALRLVAGDMRDLPLRRGSCAGVVSFYLLHHVRRGELRAVLRELHRVLVPGAPLLVATHAGAGEFGAVGVDDREITGTLYADDELHSALTAESFTVDAVRHRDPLPDERQGDRVYVAATARA